MVERSNPLQESQTSPEEDPVWKKNSPEDSLIKMDKKESDVATIIQQEEKAIVDLMQNKTQAQLQERIAELRGQIQQENLGDDAMKEFDRINAALQRLSAEDTPSSFSEEEVRKIIVEFQKFLADLGDERGVAQDTIENYDKQLQEKGLEISSGQKHAVEDASIRESLEQARNYLSNDAVLTFVHSLGGMYENFDHKTVQNMSREELEGFLRQVTDRSREQYENVLQEESPNTPISIENRSAQIRQEFMQNIQPQLVESSADANRQLVEAELQRFEQENGSEDLIAQLQFYDVDYNNVVAIIQTLELVMNKPSEVTPQESTPAENIKTQESPAPKKRGFFGRLFERK